MLNAGLCPPIPEQGSVGASGDLAPLAHLALSLIGEGTLQPRRTARAGRGRCCAAPASRRSRLARKEGLTLINGTQAHTAIAALALVDAHTALAHGARRRRDVARGAARHAGRVRRAHSGRARAARSGGVGGAACASCSPTARSASRIATNDPRVQDAYALRCMPQVHGPVLDAIDFAAGVDRPRAQRRDRQPARLRDPASCSAAATFTASRSRWCSTSSPSR